MPPAKAEEKKGADDEGDPKTRPAPNSIYLEGLGPGIWYSINYERRVIDDLGVRLGFSYIGLGSSVSSGGQTASSSASLLNFPITASYLGLRSGKHTFEVGGGVTISYATASASSGGLTGSASGVGANGDILFGYRLHPVGHAGFNFRIGLMALIGRGLGFWYKDANDPNPNGIGVLPYGYISFGGSF